MMKARKIVWSKLLAIFFALGIAAMPLRAQDDAAKPKEEQPKPAGATSPLGTLATDDDADTAKPTLAGPADPYAGSIKALGSGLPLYGTSTTPLRWGNFSIGSFEYIGIHDSFDPVGQPIPPWTNLNIFMTSIVFDKYIKKNRIVLQYLPQLAIFQGQIHGNAGANNNIALGSTFALTPRLSLTLQNAFVQVHNNQLIPQQYLAADAYAGGVVQNNFLNTNGSFIADTASATFQYAVSPRTTLTVSPMFRYAHVTAADQVNYVADGQTYQAVITLGYALTQYRKIGIIESYQYVQDSQAAVPSHSVFNTTGVFYTEQLGKALWVTANIGAEHQTYSQNAGPGQWGVSGGVSLVEDFSRRLGIVIAFTRGLTFNNYLTTRTSDRVDASLGVHITQRLTWANTLGYFSELGSDPRTSGKYAATGLSFAMFQHLTPFVDYTYSFQNSNTPQLISGMRRTLSFGIRWLPPRDLPK
jgi:hypothetical protein